VTAAVLALAALSALDVSTASGSGVSVESDSQCPTGAAVRQRLDLTPPASGATLTVRRAVLDRRTHALRVRLFGSDGRLLAERDLDAGDSCAELAAAAAIIIATWEARLAASAVPPPASMAETGVDVPAPIAPLAATRVHSPSVAVELGAALIRVASAGAQTLGGGVAIDAARAGAAIGLQLGLIVTGSRRQAVGDGFALWSRPMFTLGPRLRASRDRYFAELRAGGGAGLFRVHGTGFDIDYAHTGFFSAAYSGARVGAQLGGALVFLGVDGALALGPTRVVGIDASDVAASAEVSRFELMIGAGLAWRIRW
jgi:hypothetical protein